MYFFAIILVEKASEQF